MGLLLDYAYFNNNYQLIAVNLSMPNELDADPRAIQEIEFYGMLITKSQVCMKKNEFWNSIEKQQRF